MLRIYMFIFWISWLLVLIVVIEIDTRYSKASPTDPNVDVEYEHLINSQRKQFQVIGICLFSFYSANFNISPFQIKEKMLILHMILMVLLFPAFVYTFVANI